MILGVGTDLVEIERVSNSVARLGDRFIDRILTAQEKLRWQAISHPDQANAYVAKRFAAKEAAVKALGTGIGSGVSFQHFNVINLPSGQPCLEVDNSISERFEQPVVWHLSLTDERAYAQAFVILEAK
ncbi:holo-ACP synthase [Marinomonas posidonica]|uniref:Holo-[acyl-carrier-protein] synthase n=1 Tax=Marinomonas posidonica (strain CECT 7376 / NCIMB 14433 / IVIA-Po-181) TaxID=491952 RepID=F6CY54_MARPP|nr:holo-ACP synthase [Marinomonas posidonica]AEF55686.1 Holo-(acyl-carrier-protein) synthase [Marinomonas posidonica IVIA-Po-181]